LFSRPTYLELIRVRPGPQWKTPGGFQQQDFYRAGAGLLSPNQQHQSTERRTRSSATAEKTVQLAVHFIVDGLLSIAVISETYAH